MLDDISIEYIYKSNGITVDDFKGNVLHLGLGTGWCIRNQTEAVTRSTVIEKNAHRVNWFSGTEIPNCTIIHADALMWIPPKNVIYDVCFADMWYNKEAQSKTLESVKNKYMPISKRFLYLKF